MPAPTTTIEAVLADAQRLRRPAGQAYAPPGNLHTVEQWSLTPRRLLVQIFRPLRGSLFVGMIAGIIGTVASALVPLATGEAIDRGVVPRDTGAVIDWAVVILGLIVVSAVATVVQERRDLTATVRSAYHTAEIVNSHAAELGSSLRRHINAGDLISIGVGDTMPIGFALASTSRGAGAVVSIIVVAVIMLVQAWPLGLIVLLGVPVIVWSISRALNPLRARQRDLRQTQGELTGIAVDIATGLRIITGLGVQRRFSEHYQQNSQQARAQATVTARYEAGVSAARVLLAGMLTTAVVWVGAREVLGGTLDAGQLVAFYGYALFLVTPLRWLTDTAEFLNRGWVSLERVVGFLRISPDGDSKAVAPLPDADISLADPVSGLHARPGRLVAVICSSERESNDVAARLEPGPANLLADRTRGNFDPEELRRRVLLVPGDDYLFAGSLSEMLDPLAVGAPGALGQHLRTASIDDVVEALPDGMASRVQAGGTSFSGGERQRLRLVRALVADPEVLILVEPTSALDATTESRVMERLKVARAGRTTVVVTTSPTVVAEADDIAVIADGALLVAGARNEVIDHPAVRKVMISRMETMP
jgi:ABC-type multidrug transport system fused ATPase/permease subunit